MLTIKSIRFSSLFIVFSLVLFSCNGNDTETISDTEKADRQLAAIAQVFESLKTPMQTLEFAADTTSTLKGEKGTTILYNPGLLQFEDGTAPTGNIKLNLLELDKVSDFIKNGLTTTSFGKMLESGGAYFLGFESEGKALKLKPDSALNVAFPKRTEAEMELFYGELDTMGNVNWIASETPFMPQPNYKVVCITVPSNLDPDMMEYGYRDNSFERCDTVFFDEVLDSLMYDFTPLQNLGWINCDKYIDLEEASKLEVSIVNKDINGAYIFVVVKGRNAVAKQYYQNKKGELSGHLFSGLPLGAEVVAIAISSYNNQIFASSKQIKLGTENHLELECKATTRENLAKLFEHH